MEWTGGKARKNNYQKVTMSPLVSVIIPTRNSARTLENCLISLQTQTYANIEVIVVDNFSTDGTDTIAQKYTPKVFQKWPERTEQKNYGIEQAKGEYLLLIDGDMSLDKEVISNCVELIQNDIKWAWVCMPVVDVWRSFWTKVIAFERSFYKWTSMEAARFLLTNLVRQVGWYKSIIFYEEFIVPQEIAKLGYNVKIHTEFNIYHDYDDFIFLWNLKKKYYYGKSLLEYKKKSKEIGFDWDGENQTGIIHRYMIFLGNPRFYTQPLLALGVLFLKTMEFGAGGMGLVFSKLKNNYGSR